MDIQKKHLLRMLLAFLILVMLSLYRQLSKAFFPGDPARQYLVYLPCILMLGVWMRSLHQRITQKTMRFCLVCACWIMIFWMGVRFVQEQFLTGLPLWNRRMGYFIHLPILLIPLMGFYAACCLGKGDEYHIPRRYSLLLVPTLALLALVFTDAHHHFVYLVRPDDPQPNVLFHPNIGLILIGLWAIGMEGARVAMIFRRNKRLARKSFLYRCVPFFEMGMLCLFTLPYLLQSFQVSVELVEYSAGIFFIEVLSWEICIYVGLIPVNTQYELVFHQSTLGMQILDNTGRCMARAKNSLWVSPALFARLKQRGMLVIHGGLELWLHPLPHGCMVWQKDVSALHHIIDQLDHTGQELQKESALLSHELKARSEKAAVQEKNRIYNQLTEEVKGQLALLHKLLPKNAQCPVDARLLYRICLIGTYIKQRCNLRLIEQSAHVILPEDLDHAFSDLIDALSDMGISGLILWQCSSLACPGLALSAFDLFWYLLEYTDFRLTRIRGVAASPGCFVLNADFPPPDTPFSLDTLRLHCCPGIRLDGTITPSGCRLTLQKETDCHEAS